MPPTFITKSFEFGEGEQIPKHKNGWSGDVERDPNLWHLDGYDTFSHETYALASNIDSVSDARLLLGAYKRAIERAQPTRDSGGPSGVQDRAHIIHPRN